MQFDKIAEQIFSESRAASLLGPVGRQLRRQAHQLLGVELWRLPAVDDRGGDVRRQPGRRSRYRVGCRDALFACDSCTVRVVFSSEASLDIVSARDNPQQAQSAALLVIRVLDQHFHFAADAFQLGRRRQASRHHRTDRSAFGAASAVDRVASKQSCKSASGDVDLDAVGSDFDAA